MRHYAAAQSFIVTPVYLEAERKSIAIADFARLRVKWSNSTRVRQPNLKPAIQTDAPISRREATHDQAVQTMESPAPRQAQANRGQHPDGDRRHPHAAHGPAAAHDRGAPERCTAGGFQRHRA